MTFSRVCFASPQGGVWSDRHCEERSDEAIQSGISVWIASRHDVALAMTSRSRDASQRPRHATPLSEVVTTDLHSVLRAKRQQANAGGSIGKRRFARMTKEKNERTKEKYRRRNADRRKALLPWHRPRPRPCAERRTSIGVPPRFSSQGIFHRKGLSLRPGFLGRGGIRFAHPLSGRYPPLPVPKSSVQHAPRS
jgi:hypothetical protein